MMTCAYFTYPPTHARKSRERQNGGLKRPPKKTDEVPKISHGAGSKLEKFEKNIYQVQDEPDRQNIRIAN